MIPSFNVEPTFLPGTRDIPLLPADPLRSDEFCPAQARMGITRRSATAREIKVRLRKLTARVPQRLRLWFAGLHEPSGYRIQTSVHQPTLLALLLGRHDDVRYLKRWRLTRQRKHLVHGDPGSDRCIAQAGFANRCLHPVRS